VSDPAAPEAVPAGGGKANRRTRRRTIRASSFGIFVLAFLLLAGAAAAAAWGQLQPGKTAPVVSMALSIAAVILTLIALWLRPTR
jgi:hypothetical protein